MRAGGVRAGSVSLRGTSFHRKRAVGGALAGGTLPSGPKILNKP